MTAREVLKLFVEKHEQALHSVASWHTRSDGDMVIVCSCDAAWRIDAEICATRNTTMAHVRYGLRNAPAVKTS